MKCEICGKDHLASMNDAVAHDPLLRGSFQEQYPGVFAENKARASMNLLRDEIADAAGYSHVSQVRTFETGATRDLDNGKLVYEAFISPSVLERYALYMHKHRIQSDGLTLRTGDNWQKGIPIESYRDSLIRHVIDAWKLWRGGSLTPRGREDLMNLLCAVLFDTMGMMHEILRGK